MTRVLVVDDSPFVREQLRLLMEGDPDLTIVGEAKDGHEAIEQTLALRPDLIVMDVEMEGMDGIEATRAIMQQHPTPIVIFTSSTIVRRRNLPFEAIRCGALDVLEKPTLYPLPEAQQRAFRARLKVLSGIHVFRRMEPVSHAAPISRPKDFAPQIIAITSSTGGPKALAELFHKLPPALPVPVLLVQHIGAAFTEGFAEWLQGSTNIQMRVAQDGDQLQPNTCYIAPGGLHLTVRNPGIIHLDDSAPLNACKPSGDKLFSSIQRTYGRHAVGIILTGLGRDGAEGLRLMHSSGAVTIAQSEDSCTVFGMPRAAIQTKAVSAVHDIAGIAQSISRLLQIE